MQERRVCVYILVIIDMVYIYIYIYIYRSLTQFKTLQFNNKIDSHNTLV